MNEKFINITIETLVLVAQWSTPFIFQGCFKIRSKSAYGMQFLYFRCECAKQDKSELIENFSPDAYQFTHLFRQPQANFNEMNEGLKSAIYLLKYALHTTLTKMITSQKYYLATMDEVAMQAIAKRIEPILTEGSWENEDSEIGFAVAMDFSPREMSGQTAVLALIGKDLSDAGRESYLLH